jgi:hypothetical protein
MRETEQEIGLFKLKYKGKSPTYIKTKFKPNTMRVFRDNGGQVPAKDKVEELKMRELASFKDYL